ncbi:DUF3558 family protein [Dietzia sp. Die43]|uniref:DUF3558 family protein n=1 Tax=Dietzia sp. Die43 TaxID=2926011 RepID=UPI0021177000|nr:DUF3558 family protein [Dietzia sp. Die43]
MVAAGVVLSGCASADGGEDKSTTTTSPAAAEEPGNPWDLPIEQRPALFDPCAEIPIEAIEEGVGKAVQPIESLTRHEPRTLMSCGWKSPEVHFSALSTWKAREDYLADRTFVVRDREYRKSGRTSLRLVEKGDTLGGTCLQLFFTSAGTVWLRLDSTDGLGRFKGKELVNACDALDAATESVLPFVPKGDFK